MPVSLVPAADGRLVEVCANLINQILIGLQTMACWQQDGFLLLEHEPSVTARLFGKGVDTHLEIWVRLRVICLLGQVEAQFSQPAALKPH